MYVGGVFDITFLLPPLYAHIDLFGAVYLMKVKNVALPDKKKPAKITFAFSALLVVGLAAGLIAAALIADYFYYCGRIYPGVHVKGIHLGGKTKGEVELLLRDAAVNFSGPGEKRAALLLEETGIIPDSDAIFKAAYREGRRAGWPFSYYHRAMLVKKSPSIPFLYDLDRTALYRGTALLEQAFNREPQDAYFELHNGAVELKAEKEGYVIDKEGLANRLLLNLERSEEPFKVTVPYEKKYPRISASLFRERGVEAMLSTFTTTFDPAVTDRVHNLELAAATLNNYFLAPGETFSLNAVVGDTTPQKGYREAPIIVGGELVPGFGGGLCQISTMLYNVALLADLEIVERHSHQLTVPYVSPGRDATISYPSRDLKFRNSREAYLYINAFLEEDLEEDRLTFRLFGPPMDLKVLISTRLLAVVVPPVKYEQDPGLPPGTEEVVEGSPGCVVEVWKTVYRGGQVESVEKISVDSYTPYPTVVKQGP